MSEVTPFIGRRSRLQIPRDILVVLSVLLAIDFLFMALFLIHLYTDQLQSERYFALDHDHALGEWWQYIKTSAVCVVLAVLAYRRRAVVLLVWAAVFLYVVIDDAFVLHERAGETILEELFGPGTVLGAISVENLGELLYDSILGIAVLGGIAYAHARSDTIARRISWSLFGLVLLFVLAAFGVDALIWVPGVVAERGSASNTALILLEDGGELVVMSMTLAYVLHWLVLTPATRAQSVTSSLASDDPAPVGRVGTSD